METLALSMIVIEILGHIAVILLFVHIGACYKLMNERRGIVVFLFSLWGSLRRAITREDFRTPFSAISTVIMNQAEGAYSPHAEIKISKGYVLLLPKRRREIVEEIKKLKHVWSKDFKAGIQIQETDVRFSFYAGEEELNSDEGEKEWEWLGNLIEEEKGTFFMSDYWDEDQHYYLIEIAFTDEGREAKSMTISINPKEREAAAEWFWWRLAPFFFLSLWVVHWAILMMLMFAACFLHKEEVRKCNEREKVLARQQDQGRKQHPKFRRPPSR